VLNETPNYQLSSVNGEKDEIEQKYKQIFVDFQDRCIDLEQLHENNVKINSQLIQKGDKILMINRELSNSQTQLQHSQHENSVLNEQIDELRNE